jgi:predicted phage terminase large subunit-like protein
MSMEGINAEAAQILAGLDRKMRHHDHLLDTDDYENDFGLFLRAAWPQIDSAPFSENWAIDAMCDHLQAVTLGDISRLLINISPRCGKSTTTSIAWNAWIWARSEITFLSGPQVKFLSGSYNAPRSLEFSNKTRRLLLSPFYQRHWGDRFYLRLDQNAKSQFDNTAGGSRLATSVHGGLMGVGGDVICVDDPHNVETEKKVETDADFRLVASWWQELSTTRLNDPKQTAIVVVMQRLRQNDMSGLITKAIDEGEEDWVHLMIPMEFDERRRYWTVKMPWYDDDDPPWTDPRAVTAVEEKHDGQLMWPERFGTKELDRIRRRLGPYMYSGRFQQDPVPRGGEIINRDWWKLWDNAEANKYGLEWKPGRMEFPKCDLIAASLDTAYGEKDEHNFSAMTVWGVFNDRAGNRRAILMYGWQKRLPLHGNVVVQNKGEADLDFKERRKQAWGLVELIADTCARYGVQRLLIENKTRGHDVANELIRQYERENWGIQMVDPATDKVSRTHAIVPLFTDGAVYAPETKWSDMVLDNVRVFPKGENDDLHDTVTQFLNWVRPMLPLAEEMTAAVEEDQRYKGPPTDTVAAQYGVAG